MTRVHQSGLLHQKVWVIAFDEMWQVGLTHLPENTYCPNGIGAAEAHVPSGATVASTAIDLAANLRRSRRAAPLQPLGRPFLLINGSDRETVHIFGLVVQGIFPQRSREWFTRTFKPAAFVREASIILDSADGSDDVIGDGFCSKERLQWLVRSVSYAMRRFHLKGFTPKSNPLDDARYNDNICCREDIDTTEDLATCARPCDGENMYNILSHFPHTR